MLSMVLGPKPMIFAEKYVKIDEPNRIVQKCFLALLSLTISQHMDMAIKIVTYYLQIWQQKQSQFLLKL